MSSFDFYQLQPGTISMAKKPANYSVGRERISSSPGWEKKSPAPVFLDIPYILQKSFIRGKFFPRMAVESGSSLVHRVLIKSLVMDVLPLNVIYIFLCVLFHLIS